MVCFFVCVSPSPFICTFLVVVNSLPYCIVIFVFILAIFQNIPFFSFKGKNYDSTFSCQSFANCFSSPSYNCTFEWHFIPSSWSSILPCTSLLTIAPIFFFLFSTLTFTHFIFVLIEFHLPSILLLSSVYAPKYYLNSFTILCLPP